MGGLTESAGVGFAAGRVSTGFMHATPGEMKSFRSSAERMALMVRGYGSANAPLDLLFFVSSGNGFRAMDSKKGYLRPLIKGGRGGSRRCPLQKVMEVLQDKPLVLSELLISADSGETFVWRCL